MGPVSPSPLAARVLEIAAGQLGVREDPPGSNRGPEVDVYLRAVGLNPSAGHYPWCAAFVGWCIEEAANELHLPLLFRRSASCQRLTELNYQLDLPGPQSGSVFVHLNPNHTGHAGFVTVAHPDGSFESIEGNTDAAGGRTGGQVMRHTRAASYAATFLRIA